MIMHSINLLILGACVLYGQRLERSHLDQREQLQQLRAEQQQLQRYMDQLTTVQHQLTTGGQLDMPGGDSSLQYRVHSSLSESSNGSLSSAGYSSSEHGLLYFIFLLFSRGVFVVIN